MTETAQIILIVGVALYLALLAGSGIIWSLRSDPSGSNYKFPMLFGVGTTTAISAAYLLQQIL